MKKMSEAGKKRVIELLKEVQKVVQEEQIKEILSMAVASDYISFFCLSKEGSEKTDHYIVDYTEIGKSEEEI